MNELKLLSCPFCGEVPAEGYRLGADWHKCESGEVYISCSSPKHEGVCLQVYGENFEQAAETWNRRTEPDNKALTVEELRGMDGEPVWIVAHPDWGHWELSECAEDYFEDRDEDFYGMTMPPTISDPMGRYGLHMMGWLAYRRPPEKGE